MSSKNKNRSGTLSYTPVAEPTEMDAPAAAELVAELATERLRVVSNYAFYDDDGSFKAWAEGVVVTAPDEIKLLEARGAPVERLDQ